MVHPPQDDDVPAGNAIRRISEITLPPAWAWIRATTRLVIAAALYSIGYENVALVVGVLAGISLIAVTESQVARYVAGTLPSAARTIDTLRRSVLAKQAAIDRQAAALAKKDAQIAELKEAQRRTPHPP